MSFREVFRSQESECRLSVVGFQPRSARRNSKSKPFVSFASLAANKQRSDFGFVLSSAFCLLPSAFRFFQILLILGFLAFSGTVCVAAEEIRILTLGDSLTEGFGVEETEAYPSVLEQLLLEQGYSVRMINGGVSGSTSASALSRLKWYTRVKPHLLIFALGANDGLRGLSVERMKANLGAAIALAQQRGMTVLLAGMRMPKNYGADYTTAFRNAFPELAETHRVALVPFLLEDVGGIPERNLRDGIHPNPEGHQIIARTVLQHLKPLLEKYSP